MAKRLVWAAFALVLMLGFAPAAFADDDDDEGGVRLQVLSSPPDMVTGGDALVRLTAPRGRLDRIKVFLNGNDVTAALEVDEGERSRTGLVTGLQLGPNTLTAEKTRGEERRKARLALVNHPVTGPIFSGPQQQPFVCKTQTQGLGFPKPDNQDGIGMRLPAGGWSKDCTVDTVVDYRYRSTDGSFKALPAGPLPADVAQTTLPNGRTVPYVFRRERGTINRFIYAISMLSPPGDPAAAPDTSLWNGRLIYTFDGGVAIGHNQGTLGGSHQYDIGLRQGYAIVHSSGTRTSTHYNLVLGAETAIMTKERFIERYGVPVYTVGVGGSGGAIQQYVYAQRHPGVIIDAAIPQYSYPDMVTQTIHIGDCELLEHYMDVTDGANPLWATWPNRTWLEGLNASATWPNPYRGGALGSSECVAGWRGLTPLALNPHFGTAGAGSEFYDPAVLAAVKWTHWDDLRNIYGVDADGYAKVPWDNVGVQYGLQALKDGKITAAQFLKLNATVGSWRNSKDMVQEGCPFFPPMNPPCTSPWDPWSSRNMRLSPDGGATPAPRREGNMDAANAAYTSGLVFRGDIDIPIIDWRHYLEHRLDMHNSHQSFAARQRMLNHDGRASNQVIWFTDARPGTPQADQTPLAFQVIDEWMANIRAKPSRGVARNKPAQAVDSCFATNGSLFYSGADAWAGILDERAAGPCTQAFPLFSTSRIVAGGPIEGGVFKCALQPVERAIRRGHYGPWLPGAAEVERLEQIFPSGVCDYTKPDVGRPEGFDGGDDDD